MDRGADATVGAATADVAGHGGVDIRIAGFAFPGDQRGRTHDLAGLAVTALRHVQGDPGPLHGLAAPAFADRLDGSNILAGHGRHRGNAGTRRHTINMHRAGAALGNAATELGAGQIQLVAQYPQQRHIGGRVHLDAFSIDGQSNHRYISFPGWFGHAQSKLRNSVPQISARRHLSHGIGVTRLFGAESPLPCIL